MTLDRRPFDPQRAVGVLVALSLVLGACAGPARTGAPDTPAGGEPPAYETFDPSAFPVPAAQAAVEVVHDVPPRLMEGTVEVPVRGSQSPSTRVVDGFRVQVFSSDDRGAAERVRAEAEAWSRGQGGAAAGLRGEVAYLEPYYRVRLGAFASRAAAEEALAAVRTAYPEAFLVPDLVTVSD